MKYRTLAVLFLVAGLAAAQSAIINGDFEQDLTVGWTYTCGGTGTHWAARDPGYHSDPDYEAQTYQYDNPGWARLGQTVDVRGIALELSFWAKFVETGGTSSCWPAACFSVVYYDFGMTQLGETRYVHSTYANWVPSPTLSLYRVGNPDWTCYTLDIAGELAANLPGVDPAEVSKIEVALYSYTYDG